MNKRSGLIQGKSFLATIILLSILIAVTGVLTHVVPAGEFETVEKAGAPVKEYRELAPAPPPLWRILLSPVLCLTGSNGPKLIVLILFILLIGGSFSVMNDTGFLPAVLGKLVERFSGQKTLFLLLTVLFFSLVGSTLGILEEIVPLILIFVPIAYRMGWDGIAGLAIPFLSAGIGFAAATFNPFTIGTAQRLADLALFSGLSIRAPLFVVTTSAVFLYILRYTRRIERDPSRSLVYGTDRAIRDFTRSADALPADGPGVHDEGDLEGEDRQGAHASFAHLRTALVHVAICLCAVVGVVVAGNFVHALADLAFPLIALVFVIMGIGTGAFSGRGRKAVARSFFRGIAAFSPAVILILMAGAVGYLMETGGILPTILAALSKRIGAIGPGLAAVLLYIVNMGINFFIPSGSGQAVLAIPILAPLGDLLGITRQTVVLAFQFGDGFSNLLWPTNPMLLIALGLAGIQYGKWLRWVLPLQLFIFALCSAALLLAVAVGYR